MVAEFERLHRPLSEIYELGPERRAELWRHLDLSFAGEALTREYVEHFTTAAGMARDGTRIRIASLDYESVAVVDRGRDFVTVDVDWSVGGLVTHRRHTHPRINRYVARFTLAPAVESPHELRIVGSEMRDLERQGRLAAGTAESALRSARGSLSLGDLIESGLAEELIESRAAAGDDDREPR